MLNHVSQGLPIQKWCCCSTNQYLLEGVLAVPVGVNPVLPPGVVVHGDVRWYRGHPYDRGDHRAGAGVDSAIVSVSTVTVEVVGGSASPWSVAGSLSSPTRRRSLCQSGGVSLPGCSHDFCHFPRPAQDFHHAPLLSPFLWSSLYPLSCPFPLLVGQARRHRGSCSRACGHGPTGTLWVVLNARGHNFLGVDDCEHRSDAVGSLRADWFRAGD